MNIIESKPGTSTPPLPPQEEVVEQDGVVLVVEEVQGTEGEVLTLDQVLVCTQDL